MDPKDIRPHPREERHLRVRVERFGPPYFLSDPGSVESYFGLEDLKVSRCGFGCLDSTDSVSVFVDHPIADCLDCWRSLNRFCSGSDSGFDRIGCCWIEVDKAFDRLTSLVCFHFGPSESATAERPSVSPRLVCFWT